MKKLTHETWTAMVRKINEYGVPSTTLQNLATASRESTTVTSNHSEEVLCSCSCSSV